jgi:hypothetical protein
MSINLLNNGDFRRGLTGWKKTGPEGKSEAGVNLSEQWSLEGVPTAYLCAKSPDLTTGITQEFLLRAPAAEVQRVKLGASFGTHRTEGEVVMAACDKKGRQLSELKFPIPHRPAKAGGTKADGYAEISLEYPTPPGTHKLSLTIRTGPHSGAKDPTRYLFLHSLMVAPGNEKTDDPTADLREENKLLLSQLHQTQEELERYFVDNRRCQALEKQLSEQEITKQQINAAQKEVSEQLDQACSERDSATRERDELKSKLTAAAAAAAVAASDFETKLASLAEAHHAERETTKKENDQLKTTLAELQHKIQQLDQSLSNVSKDRSALKKVVSEGSLRIAELETQLADQSNRQQQINEEMAKADGQLQMLKDLLRPSLK